MPPLVVARAAYYPESLLWAAEAQERLGEREKARAGVEKLLGFWKRADPDLPLLAQARAFCRKVACRPPEARQSGGGKP